MGDGEVLEAEISKLLGVAKVLAEETASLVVFIFL